MKKIKSLTVNIESPMTIYHEHSIYELTDEEMKKSCVSKKYLLDRTFGNYAMNKIDHIDLIERAKRDSEYVYGVAFSNTVDEAELAYKNAVLECIINELKNKLESVKEELDKAIKVSDNEIEFEVN